MANYDILGNIAIMKFQDETSEEEKKRKAEEVVNQYKAVETVLEKLDKVKGRLRTIKTRLLLGKENLIASYKENGCVFKLNVETCYFSSRLANERMEIAKRIKKSDKVLVMFAGVGPFSLVIAKQAKPKKIISIELGKECCKYAVQNAIKNKVENIMEILQGDVKKIIPKIKEKFEVIVMPRPNLKDSFIKEALAVSKKGTRIIYYGFSPEIKKEEMISDLLKEIKECKKKIEVVEVKEAGDIAPYEHRYRIEMKVL